jgi:hypothetical protein
MLSASGGKQRMEHFTGLVQRRQSPDNPPSKAVIRSGRLHITISSPLWNIDKVADLKVGICFIAAAAAPS